MMPKPLRQITTKQPKRVYSDRCPHCHGTGRNVNTQWHNIVRAHGAKLLKNGENPSDHPNHPVAFETQNFGWVLSAPHPETGKRKILYQG